MTPSATSVPCWFFASKRKVFFEPPRAACTWIPLPQLRCQLRTVSTLLQVVWRAPNRRSPLSKNKIPQNTNFHYTATTCFKIVRHAPDRRSPLSKKFPRYHNRLFQDCLSCAWSTAQTVPTSVVRSPRCSPVHSTPRRFTGCEPSQVIPLRSVSPVVNSLRSKQIVSTQTINIKTFKMSNYERNVRRHHRHRRLINSFIPIPQRNRRSVVPPDGLRCPPDGLSYCTP